MAKQTDKEQVQYGTKAILAIELLYDLGLKDEIKFIINKFKEYQLEQFLQRVNHEGVTITKEEKDKDDFR